MQSYRIDRTDLAKRLKNYRRSPRAGRTPRVFNVDCLYRTLLSYCIPFVRTTEFLRAVDAAQPNRNK